MSEGKIIGLGGQELKSEEKLTEEQRLAEEQRKEQLELLKKKQEEAEAAYQQQIKELEEGRLDIGDPNAQDIVSRIQAIREVVTANIYISKREPQNIKNPETGETNRMNVPVSSFAMNLFEYSNLRQAQMLLLDRMMELIYKL